MKRIRLATKVLALVMLMVPALRLLAQDSTPPAATQSGNTQDDKDKQAEPEDDTTPGQGRISEFGEALAKFWSVNAAFQASQAFDDNVFVANNFRKSDTVTRLAGRITGAYRGRHTRFEASYMPEFHIYQRYAPLNYTSHDYIQSFRHEFSRRLSLNWNLNAYQAPSRGNLPFKIVNFGGMRFAVYSLEALNDGLNIFNGSTNVGISYRWNSRWKSTGSIEGTASHFSVRGTPTSSPLTREVLYSTAGHFNTEFVLNDKQTIGFSLSETYFGGVDPADHQHLQTVRGLFKQKFRGGYLLSVSAGPGITERQGGSKQISAFYEISLQRRMTKMGYALMFQRTSQVGLLQDSVTGMGGGARLNWSFGRNWLTNWGVNYLRSESAAGRRQLESFAGNGQIGYRLTRHITPYLNYGYVHQKNLAITPTARNVNRNEVAVGFVYNFGTILGE